MIELKNLHKDIKLDIRYASKNNFLGRAVYSEPRAFLRKCAAEALLSAHLELIEFGFGVLVFDGYRPWSVTKVFWENVSEDEKRYVANPKFGSVHNRGCAIDMSIYELESGAEVKMPSGFDEFNEKAHPKFEGASAESKKHRDFLIRIMERHEFTVNKNEWWHFDHRDWAKYEILDVPFSEL